MAMPKLPPDVEKIADESRAAADTIFDKRRTWMAFLAFGALCLILGRCSPI